MDQPTVAASVPETIMIGKEIGSYKILKELGRGGMGVVYKANQVTLGRMVAMKVLPNHLSADPSFIKRFENEARSIAKLNHPNIVQIYDIGNEGDLHYYTMEFLEGPSLDQIIYREGFMPLDRALNIILQVARSLQYAHSQGIVHRDVKPSNIILDRSSRVKITDFGLALQERGTRLTIDGSIVGTPEYMAPEQAAAEPATARSDIYSLGVVFYELLTGKIPFEGESAPIILKKVQSAEPEWPRSLNPNIPVEGEKVIQRMMAKRPRDRYANCQELIRDLRRLKAGQPIPVKRKAPAGLKAAAAALAGILILVTVVFYRVRQERHSQSSQPAAAAPQEQSMPAEPPQATLIPVVSPVVPSDSPAQAPPPPRDELAWARQRLSELRERLEEVRLQEVSPDALYADTIIFKKGNKIRCSVLNESLEKIRIRMASGLAEIPREEVSLLIYATPEEKQAAEHARQQEQERSREEQRLRKEIAGIENRAAENKQQLQPLFPAKSEEKAAVLQPAPEDTEPDRQPQISETAFKESISLSLGDKWHIASSCGKKAGFSFEEGSLIVSTSQSPVDPACSIILETNEPIDGRLHSVELLLEVKRLIVADDRITASLAASFADGTATEYLFFDSEQEQLNEEIRQTPDRLIISHPENTVLFDAGWHALRLPVAADSVKLKEGEKLARISLIHTQANGGGVFLFRYKAIILNMM